MSARAAALLLLLLGLASAGAHTLDAGLGTDGAGGTAVDLALGLDLPALRLSAAGLWQRNRDGDEWTTLQGALDSDPAAPLQAGAWAAYEGNAGLDRLASGPRLTLDPGPWSLRLEGGLARVRLRLNRPIRPFTDQDRLELSALEARLDLAYYGLLGWSFHAGAGRREHSRDLGLLDRRPQLALRLFTPTALDAGYTLEARAWRAGVVRYREHGELALWWNRSVSAVDGAVLDTLTLAARRGRLTLDLGLTLQQGASGLYLRPGLTLGP